MDRNKLWMNYRVSSRNFCCAVVLWLLVANVSVQMRVQAATPFSLAKFSISTFDGGAAWGDCDNDGDLDLLISARVQDGGTNLLQIWRNDGGGSFTEVPFGATAIAGSVAWADFDNDGYLDAIASGWTNYSGPGVATGIWRNQNGTNFLPIPNTLAADYYGTLTIADFDNDGRQDIAMTGSSGATNAIFRNLGSFGFSTNRMPGFPNPVRGLVKFGDVDNDGWPDLFVAGQNLGKLYLNQEGKGLTESLNLFTASIGTRGEFADYNNDGRLDLVTAIPHGGGSRSNVTVWFNTGTGFADAGASFPQASFGLNLPQSGAISWGDYDNDGLSDLFLSWGRNNSMPAVYRNNGNHTFSDIMADFPALFPGPAFARTFGIWGDANNDGRLDLFFSDYETESDVARYRFSLHTNSVALSNTPPAAPQGLTHELTVHGTNVVLRWLAAADAETPPSGLSYNIRVGTTPGACDVVSPMSDAATGYRRLPALGNAFQRHFSVLTGLEMNRTYYWSVQAIDGAFAGGAWSPEASFTTRVPIAGDVNGDGMVSGEEFDLALANYLAASPYLKMTNMAGLGGSTVTFALTNGIPGSFRVEYSTNLTDWEFLGTATPRYLFIDPEVGAAPQRFYRLRRP